MAERTKKGKEKRSFFKQKWNTTVGSRSNYDVTIARRRTSSVYAPRWVNNSPACHLTKALPRYRDGMRLKARERVEHALGIIFPSFA